MSNFIQNKHKIVFSYVIRSPNFQGFITNLLQSLLFFLVDTSFHLVVNLQTHRNQHRVQETSESLLYVMF